jgi:hypothetical protein
MTDSFSGIAPGSALPFVVAQIVTALLASWMLAWLFGGQHVLTES